MTVRRPDFDPVQLARATGLNISQVREALKPGGFECVHCMGKVQFYPRSVNSDIARALLYSYPLFKRNPGKWLHLSQYLAKEHDFRSGDYSKAVYWKLLERSPEERPHGKKSSGKWRLTERGLAFLEERYTVPNSHVLEYIHKPIPGTYYGGPRTIRQALGRNWNYDQLMAGHTDTD